MTARQAAGRTLYWLVHAPVGRVRAFFADGGPLEQRRTELGRRQMEAAAWSLPVPTGLDGPPLVVHLLTGHRFWYQTAFCLYTLARTSGRQLAPRLYDDGTLMREECAALLRLFRLGVVVPQTDTRTRLDTLLPRARFPVLRERWDHYPNLRKLIDPHLGSKGWKLVIDSDLLFFRTPAIVTAWLDRPSRPFHAVDVHSSYGYSAALLSSFATAPLPARLNVGLCGLLSEEMDWDRLEWLCRTLIERERTNYYLEQALVAVLLAGRECIVAPGNDYVTLPRPPEAQDCRAVMHHYVAGSKRWYFQSNWRRCLGAASGVSTGSAARSATSGAQQ